MPLARHCTMRDCTNPATAVLMETCKKHSRPPFLFDRHGLVMNGPEAAKVIADSYSSPPSGSAWPELAGISSS